MLTTTATKPEIMKIYSTRDYHKFKRIGGNRPVNQSHLKKLKASMQKKSLVSPITVNERFEIIDGQHRFLVRQELGLPLHYFIVEGYGLEEVQILNTNSKDWKSDDFLDSYIQQGNDEYLKFKQLKDRFKFGHSTLLLIIGNRTAGFNEDHDEFKRGELEIEDYDGAVKICEKIAKVGKYYKEHTTRHFIIAMMQCFANPNYDHDTFLQKLEYQSLKMVKVADSKQALAMIEEIYNHRNKVKVNLRIVNP